MQDSTLIKACRKLNKKEWKLFERLINSPYFNTDKTLIRLFQILKKDHPDFDSPRRLKKEVVYSKLFNDGTPFDKNRLYPIMSNLKGLVDILIIQESLKNKPLVQSQLRLSWLQTQDEHETFEIEIAKQIKNIEINQVLSIEDHQNLYDLHYQWQNHPQTQRPKLKKDSLVKHFMHATLSKWLSLMADLHNRRKMLSERQLLDDTTILSYVIRQKYFNSSTIQGYVYIIQMYIGEISYQEVKDWIIRNWDLLSKQVQREFWVHLLNQAGFLNRQGKIGYLRESWELYKMGTEHDLVTKDDNISDLVYVNMIAAAAVVNQITFAKDLVIRYRSYLKPKFAQFTKALAMAYIYFYEAKWTENPMYLEKCLEELSLYKQSRSPIERFTLRAHCIRLRAIYDLYYTFHSRRIDLDSFDKARDSFERYLDRNRAGNLISYRNFLKVISRLAHIYFENDNFSDYHTKKTKLKIDINQTDQLLFRDWFLEKVEALH